LEDFIQRLEDDKESRYVYREGNSAGITAQTAFFADHPHFLLTMGFDEYVALNNRKQFKKYWFGKGRCTERGSFGESIYRRPNGDWWWLSWAPISRDGEFVFNTKSTYSRWVKCDFFDEEAERNSGAIIIPLETVFSRLYSICDKWQNEPFTLWSPSLWTPNAQRKESIVLSQSVSRILTALQSERIDLKEVSWQHFEEIVAELLRAYGMEIHVVRNRPQGGRDIVARGELIPGLEPLTIAVEVKHRAVVDRPEVDAALWQNRAFPALLFATSGRFTAGVLEEKCRPENQLRLFLKDGVALGDMLRDYWNLGKPPFPK
jgi:hypothetical protein